MVRRRGCRATREGAVARVDSDIVDRIIDLEHDYAHSIDDDRLEDWPDLFVEDCLYQIIPRENLNRGTPLPIIYCDNKDMLRDRVVILRRALIYNLHYDRHVVGNVRVRGEEAGTFEVWASFIVLQTDTDGETSFFASGKYEDLVVFVDGEAKFKQKVVVLDTAAVPNMISTPL